MIKLAIVGLGHWGPNYLRIFSQINDCKIVACMDCNETRLENFKKIYPYLKFYRNLNELYKKEKMDAVIIATPTSSHFSIALQALQNSKHILVEKPLALTISECMQLTQLAKEKNKILMVGHTFLYNDAVIWLKKFLQNRQAGRIYYIYATRTNLGPIRQDVNSLIDLSPHDISIFLYLLGKKPSSVSAHGASFLNNQREDVSFLTLYFDEGIVGHIHVSWLDPRKVRQITVIGNKKMILFDDINPFEPIRIYDKSVKQQKEYSDYSEFKTILYEGDVVIPKVYLSEPLKNQCREFLTSIDKSTTPLSDGIFGTEVSNVLIGAMKSLNQKGAIISLT
ncbi:MAG: Gfo/Idh/MocA family oxidoreductase [Elusimicrobia bacterium]|nr:Gfo/Idh/MocA family oxidoreductase [Elusimicrobiota bacterium]